MPLPPESEGEGSILLVCPVVSFVRLFVRPSVGPIRFGHHDISWEAWTLAETGTEHSQARIDLIRFWRSKVKGQGHGRPNYVVMKTSTSTLGFRRIGE